MGSLYKNAIMYDISNNNTFEKVKIENNKIICSNKDILKDIQTKYENIKKQKLNINICVFYVSLCDYKFIKNSYYWDNIKHLDLEILPIYKKNNNLYDFITWYKKNFNNNKIAIYETDKFTKRKHVFDNKQNCLDSVNYIQTNPKHKKYNQIFYHASSISDIERYGFIYIRYIFNTTIKNNICSSLSNNIFNKYPIKIWNKFSISFESVYNTINYMMNKMKKGILVAIKDNKLCVFLPFSKYNYTNDYYTELYFDDKDKELLKKYKKNINSNSNLKELDKIKKQLKQNTINFFKKLNLPMKNINFDRTKWVGNDCFFRYEDYEGDKSVALYQDFFVNLCKNREIPDSIFMLNIRDHPILHKDLKDAYVNVVDRKLDSKYIHNEYTPILSVGASKYTADIPLITQDDWGRVSKKFYPDDCSNGYIDIENIKVDWNNKIDKCIFRGSATGCYIDENNVRIKATMLSKKYPELLDAGITSFNRKIKKNIGKSLVVIKPQFNKATFVSLQDRAKYKYILTLDGHVSAFRLGSEMVLGSVLLLPDSEYYIWFSYLLVPYKHYVPVKRDLSDLITQIEWCKENDEKCKKIANYAKEFYYTYLTEKGVYDYMQKVLCQISFKSLNLPKFDKKIAIIIIYRNSKDNTRLEEKRKYLYWMNKLLHNRCDYDIILVEQNYTDKFNIGKLKNIGFDYLTNKLGKKYDNYIFSDIDMIPDSNLLQYYFKTTDSINGLAWKGTRYEIQDVRNKTPFVGGVISSTSTVFKQLNGYPNNFYGWEGEDVNFLLRMYEEKKPLYINKKGRVIDIEENDEFTTKQVTDKLEQLKQSNEREENVYEKNIDYKNYKQNGLSTLIYDVIQEFSYPHNYHIIIDPLKNKCMDKYPQLYKFKPQEKDSYNQVKRHLKDIKQILF